MEARVRGGKAHSEHFLSGVPQKAAVLLDAANGTFVPITDALLCTRYSPIAITISARKDLASGGRVRFLFCHPTATELRRAAIVTRLEAVGIRR
jgi:hypothetical protein